MSTASSRRDLLVAVEAVMQALLSNEPTAVPLAPDARCTANGVPGSLGSGAVWGRALRAPARQTFVDPETGQAVLFGVLSNATSRHTSRVKAEWFYALRIAVRGSHIAEVEEIWFEGTWAHYGAAPAEVEMDPRFEAVVPEDERSTREEMRAAVRAYGAAVARTGPADAVPLHPDARRTELGQVTTEAWNFPHTVRGDFRDEGWRWALAGLRIPIVDVVRGVAVGIFGIRPDEGTHADFTSCIVAEAFKIEDGLIRRMWAVYSAGSSDSGWPASEPA